MAARFERTDRIVPAMQQMNDGLDFSLSDSQLIAEAIACDLAEIGNEKTLERYEGHLEHYSEFLRSRGQTFYTARRKDVSMFMKHLTRRGGTQPHPQRRACDWCSQHGFPDGRKGHGWSASYRKSFLSAIRFLYKHFFLDESLPDINPSAHV